jgi:hypothetical protein
LRSRRIHGHANIHHAVKLPCVLMYGTSPPAERIASMIGGNGSGCRRIPLHSLWIETLSAFDMRSSLSETALVIAG